MIYSITNGAVSAKINTKGGELNSFTKNGKEYLWQGNPEFWGGQAPILFPVVARCRDGKLTIKGKSYPMPKHGFVRDSELKVTAQTENSITLTLTENAQTKQVYPWNFQFSVTYTIDGDRLTCTFQVVNTDKEAILFGVGGHPAFHVPMEDGEKFEDYCLEFELEEILYSNHVAEDDAIMAEDKDLILDSGRVLPLKRNLFNNDAMIFEDIQSKWVKLIHKDTKKGLHFAYEDFPIFAVWTKGEPIEAPYVCLEPWFSMGFRDDEGDTMEEKYGIQRLAPGAVFEATFSAEIID